jgi:hypothetical protein
MAHSDNAGKLGGQEAGRLASLASQLASRQASSF